jgi:methionyl-tRNA formyltransferase
MKITVLCTDPAHPVMKRLREWSSQMQSRGHEVALVHGKAELTEGDVLFLVSCSQLIGPGERASYKAALVLHASDLPNGRGWSPYIWDVLEGADEVTICMLEASDPVDTGRIWLRQRFALEGHELLPEINNKLFTAELALMTQVIEEFDRIAPQPQRGNAGPYRRRRIPADSRLDPEKSLAAQFNLLRVVDAERFPAFMDFRGKRYLIKIEKVEDNERQ